MIGFAYCTAAELEPGDVIDCLGSGHAPIRRVWVSDTTAVVWLQPFQHTTPLRPIRCAPTTRFRRKV